MARLPTIGTISYNGVDFDAYLEGARAPVEARFVFDRPGRTVSNVQYTIDVEGVISHAVTTDQDLETLRRRLAQPAGELRFDFRGFGSTSLHVNPPGGGGIRDCNWGPKPEVLNWTPLGVPRAAKFRFRCVTNIPECVGGEPRTKYKFHLMESVYRYHVAIDHLGLTTLTITGHAVIPQTRDRVDARTLTDCADRYLEQILPPCPPGFQRQSQSHTVDESKNQIDYSVTYKEQPTLQPLPAGVLDCQASFDVQSDSMGFASWTATIAASYTLEKGAPKAAAWGHFFALYAQRVAWAKAQIAPGERLSVIALKFSFGEPNLYGPEALKASISYRIVCPLARILNMSGMWLPVPGNYNAWKASLANVGFHPRGYAKLRLRPEDDLLVNLCLDDPPRRLLMGAPPPLPAGVPLAMPASDVAPESSWLAYQMHVAIECDDGTIEHKPLDDDPNADNHPERVPTPTWARLQTVAAQDLQAKGQTLKDVKPDNAGALAQVAASQSMLSAIAGQSLSVPGDTKALLSSTAGWTPPYRGRIASVQQGVPSLYVTLYGKAMRAGYPITCPVLTSLAGVPAIPANRAGVEHFTTGVVYNAGGVPVVAATWRQRYLFQDMPERDILPPPSPSEGVY